MRTAIGYPAIEELDQVKAQMKKDQDQLKAEVQSINTEVTNMVNEFQKKAEAKAADASQFDALKQRAREVVDAFANNTDQSYKAQLTRLKDLTVNQAKLSTAMALNYIDLRRDLELANDVNAKAKQVVEDGLAAAKAELDDTIKKDEEARAELVQANADKAEALAAADTRLTNIVNENQVKDREAREDHRRHQRRGPRPPGRPSPQGRRDDQAGRPGHLRRLRLGHRPGQRQSLAGRPPPDAVHDLRQGLHRAQ